MTTGSFDPVANALAMRAMRAQGLWLDKTIDEFLAAAISATPDKPALVAYRADRTSPRRFSYRELGDLVARATAALHGLGVGPGDVVAVQVPNWWEFVVVSLAANRIGAVVNPLMPIFREREMGFMLGFAHAKLLVVPKLFRGFDHAAMAQALRAQCPDLVHVIVIDDDGPDGFEQRLLGGSARVDAGEAGLAADALAVLMARPTALAWAWRWPARSAWRVRRRPSTPPLSRWA